MKFTVVIVTLLSISSTWAVPQKKIEDQKDKREAPSSYPSQQSSAQTSLSYQPSLGHGDANAISVGAGYSIGGAKPSYNFGGSGAGLQLSSGGQQSGHGSIQLAPITLQPQQAIVGSDLSQIMSQLSHSLNSGALTLQPSNSVAEFHEGGQGGQEYAFAQLNYAPKLQQYTLGGQISSAPSYASGTKGLSSYGSTGPVLFNPSQGQEQVQQAYSFAPSAGHASADAGSLSYGGAGNPFGGISLGGAGHSLGGAAFSFGGSGYSPVGGQSHASGLSLEGLSGYPLGGAGYSLGGSEHGLGQSQAYALGSLGGSENSLGGHRYALGGSGYSIGNSGHSLGGSGGSSGGHYKALGGSYSSPSKSTFKPSTYLGASIPGDSGSSGSHGASSFSGSGSHGSSSFPSFSSSSSHGALALSGPSFGSFGGFGGGSSKYSSPLFTKAHGSSLDSSSVYSSAALSSSPPGTTYGFPTSSYPGAVHAASSGGPQYYIGSSKYPSSFGEASSSYKAPSFSHSSLSSHSSSPKYSFGSHGSSSRYGSPKDSSGAYSETAYNTIKYSEELKPRVH